MPSLPPPLWADLYVNGAWTSITDDVGLAAISSRGRSSERDSTGPGQGSLSLLNTSGKYSRRNPTSELYGKVGLNTPVRYGVDYGAPWAVLSGASATDAYFSTPNSAGLDVADDLEVRAELAMDDWTRTQNICGRYAAAGNRSWALSTTSDGYLRLFWTADGTTVNTATSTIPMPAHAGQRVAVKMTVDTSNTDGVYEIRFWTSKAVDDDEDYWSLIGAPVIGAAATSVYSPTAALEAGVITNGSNPGMAGRLYRVQLRDGIGGTVLADFDTSQAEAGDTSFVDSTGKTWTAQGTATLSNRHTLLSAEVPSWTPTRDKSGNERWMPIQPAGILRRLDAGNKLLRSPMFRELSSPTRTNIVAYWPMEDAASSASIASGLANTLPASISGAVSLAASTVWNCSDALPTFTTGHVTMLAPTYTSTNEISIRALVNAPSGGTAGEVTLFSFTTTGTARQVVISMASDGDLRYKAYDSDSATLVDSGLGNLNINGETDAITIEMSISGSTITYRVIKSVFTAGLTVDDSIPGVSFSGTFSGTSVGRVTSATIGGGGDLAGTSVGHFAIADDLAGYSATSDANTAWNGEKTHARFIRLCAEQGVTASAAFYDDDQPAMGYQRSATFLDLLREIETADMGIFGERQDAPELVYRGSATLRNQAPVLEVDFDAGVIDDMPPKDDDRAPFNEITVKRASGSEYTYALETGVNSIDDIGRYDTSVDVSLSSDAALPSQAYWRVAIATVDEMRYPKVTFNLANTATSVLFDALMRIDIGDKLRFINLPADFGPSSVELLVFGINDVLSGDAWSRALNCVPASPWTIAVRDNTTFGRRDTAGSELASDATSSATSLSVATTTGPLWTTDAGHMPFTITVGGEEMTVTAISGTSSPQTFTVTRSVNGVVKAQTTGEAVSLAQPARRGL